MTDEAKIIIRPMTEADFPFIMATWLRGNYYGNPITQSPAHYYNEYPKIIKNILSLPNVEIRIAGIQGDPLWIAGFSVITDRTLYWVYVKKGFRKKGIATLLMGNRAINQVIGRTKVGKAITEKKGFKL